MDEIDRALLQILRMNARSTAAEMAKRIRLSVPAVLERMKKLTRNGILLGYTVRLDRRKLGCSLLAFVQVRLNAGENIAAFRERIPEMPCVLECHHIAGAYDYLLKITVEDTQALEHFLSVELNRLGSVMQTNTQIVLTTLKEVPDAPL